ncbi:MAG: gamma-glutamylcyclotransferase family protein [Pseudomonadota bacterium]
MKSLVFVYGTLKQGQRNYGFVEAAEYMGNHQTEPAFTMYEFDDYPAVTEWGVDSIYGELYRVNRNQFRKLDELEWYPRFYQRIKIKTHLGLAWMYVVKHELCVGKRRCSGRWPDGCR